MSTHEERIHEIPVRRATGLEKGLSIATGLALIGCGVLAINAHHMSTKMAMMGESNRAQLARISDQLSQSAEESRQRMETIARSSQDSATTNQELARNELRRANALLAAKIAATTEAEKAAQQEIHGQLDELKTANTTASSKLDTLNGDVSTVKGDLSNTQANVETANNELKRVNGDLGVMSGLIATNGKELQSLRDLGEKNYTEFTLKRTAGMQKVGNVQLALAKADAKRNRYTLDVMADDKKVEKRDRTVNEPVQLYMAGYRQPVEIVVNEVKKDEVVGYVAVPKVKAAR